MVVDDAIFYSSMLVCVSLGSHYKKIENIDMKKNYGAGLGILIACLICGHHVYHSIFMVWGNVIIIKCCDKKYVHQISLAFTWTYLIYLYYNIQYSQYLVWFYQTLALRLVGLAFETYLAEKSKSPDSKSAIAFKSGQFGDMELMSNAPTAVEIVQYAYYFIGLHKGPYYTWKVFNDHFNTPFGVLGDCRIITEQKMKKALVCAVGYMVLRMKFSADIYDDNNFYKDYGTDFRFLYNVPQLVMFFLRCQLVMLLCTSICTETGFGVYPAKCQPVPGFGPSVNYSLLRLAADTPDVALEQEYNFAMLKCFDNEKLLLGPKMGDSMRGWDMSTRYWYWSFMYKNFIKSNKQVRSACSMVAWSIWHGLTLQKQIISATLWVYVHLEEEYSSLYNTTGSMKAPWDIGFSIMRLFCLIYLTPCFVLTDKATVLRYFNSIFWVYHFVLLALTVAAVVIFKMRVNSQPVAPAAS